MFADVAGRAPRPRRPFTPFVEPQRARGRRQGQARRHRHPHPLLGRPADLPRGRRRSTSTSCSPGPARPRSWCPGSTIVIRDDCAGEEPHRGDLPLRRRHHRVRASTSRRTRRSPTSGACRAPAPSPRPCRCSTPTGHMMPTEVERECDVDIALRWGTGYDTEVRSFVNIIATPKGGTHLAGFEQALLKVLRKPARAERAPAQGRQRQAREGRRPRGPHRGAHGAAARAAVRGPDQGGARHPRGARHRGAGRRAGAHRAARPPPSATTRSRPRCCSTRSSPR